MWRWPLTTAWALKAAVPVGGRAGAAPDREARDGVQPQVLAAQRKVVDDDQPGRVLGDRLGQPRFGVAHARGAPVGHRRVGLGLEQHLVHALQAGLRGPRQRVLVAHPVGPEAVVVEHEGRRDAERAAARPARIRIFGRQHAVGAADRRPAARTCAARAAPRCAVASTARGCPAPTAAGRTSAPARRASRAAAARSRPGRRPAPASPRGAGAAPPARRGSARSARGGR